ncbi:MAG: carboxyl-terminal processing protease [Planctomycetota bacterium]|jgi:carboxyl-terminal processing protease
MDQPTRLASILAIGISFASVPAPAGFAQQGALLEDVVRELERKLYDRAKRELVAELARPILRRARSTKTEVEERLLVHELLESLGVSHLALYSADTYQTMRTELSAETQPSLGVQLQELDGEYFACWIFEGGPADRAGILRGDRVVAIDGVRPERSARLDWRSDDSALPDPPLHGLLCEERDVVEFTLEGRPGQRRSVAVRAEPYGGWPATLDSIRVLREGDLRIGYVHFWFIPFDGPARLLRELIAGEFASCDALIVDLRGRGGSASEVPRMVDALAPTSKWDAPVICLSDRGTRSAKEVIADQVQKREIALVVGERTAGAVIPATFREVGRESVLMFPTSTLGRHTANLEGIGVEPDVYVDDAFRYAAGRDPILEAGLRAAVAWCEEL